MDDEQLTIAQMATRTGLSVHTLRYYERIGLLAPVDRATNGHRRYDAHDVAWVDFLTRLRATGMSIEHMRTYSALRRNGASTIHERRVLLETHQHIVEERIADLQRNVMRIKDKIATYQQMEERDAYRNDGDAL